MATYDFRNRVTGERRTDVIMSFDEKREFLRDNPDWHVMVSMPKFVSDTKSVHTRAGSEWADVLKRVERNNIGSKLNY